LASNAPLARVSRTAYGAVRLACRPSAWAGAAREGALCAFNVATYPLGIRPGTPSWEAPLDEQSRRARTKLALDPRLAATPVLLVHGYVHNRSAFLALKRQLKRAGFRYVDGVNYNALEGIPQAAARLGAEVERVLTATGMERVMIVGHSMGGMVTRYYVQELGGEDTVDTVITLGSPHRGTYTSYVGVGEAATQLRPSADLIQHLESTARPGPVRWIAYWSDLDIFITPPAHARLDHPALRAHNVRVRNTGHLSLLASGFVIRDVLAHLTNPQLHRAAEPEVASVATTSQRRRRPVTVPAASADARLARADASG
jgi:pimeloyl-ACP methyl ester carboxylesterase